MKLIPRVSSRIGAKEDSSLERTLNNRLVLVPIFLVLIGAGAIIASVASDLLGLGSQSGYGGRQLAVALCGMAVLLTGIILIASGKPRQIAEWLLIVIGVIIVALASNLVIQSGLPEFGMRQLLIVCVMFCVLMMSVAAPFDREHLNESLKTLSLNKHGVLKFLGLAAQVGLLVVVVGQFDLENRAFSQNILPLIFYGFLIHFLLPARYRLPFYLLLSILAIIGIFGLSNGAWLIIIGLVMVGICHLPVPFWARVAILLIVGAGLVLLRADLISYSWSGAIWPILGSIFMFRLIIYMYDLKHQKEPFSIARTLSYFFMLPNVVFPLFPVVDFSTFRRTYYDTNRYDIYQKGVDWMLRGIVQLILYRFVSYYLVISPEQVIDVSDLVRYILATFLLYLRVSGTFHLIVGILHLFGFNLPETHHLFFLASSFTDFWRRINIYWKDFMLKVFYYPSFFRVRKLGATSALVISTLFVFLVTWFFHAYQWFWLRGSFLLTWTDTLFWAILAILVVVNSLYEAKYGKKRTLTKPAWTWSRFVSVGMRTVGTFVAIALLWTLWSSASLSEFFSLWAVKGPQLTSTSDLVPTLLVVGLIFGGKFQLVPNSVKIWLPGVGRPSFFRSALITGGSILILCLIASPVVHTQLLPGKAQELIRDLKVARLNDRDAALLQRGYYEDLIGVNRFNSQLWEVYMNRPGDAGALNEVEVTQQTGGFLKQELGPLVATIHFGNIPFRTNRWGMRDQDYEQIPSPNTYRIAVVGASSVMGWGVADNETFESILEDRLNREQNGVPPVKYELLNFGVSGYSPPQELMLLENKVFDFQPKAIFYMAHQYDEGVAIQHLAERIRAGVDVPYDFLSETARAARVDQDTPATLAEKRLTPLGAKMISWTYREIVDDSRKRGILPIWVFMPTPELKMPEENITTLKHLAEEAGFVVLDLSDVYDGRDIESLWVAEWDHHPNAEAHAVFADRLYKELLAKHEDIPLGPPNGSATR